ncbi:hypothetical protein HTVC103P_gp53 [Pelagibacter phage HTVC103P]|nr:hypothetical protein HTVC103P_gp53 [Pelagibacter phage HTVC103P]
MALDKSDVLGSIFTGWWEADKIDTAQRLKIRNEELANRQNTIKQIKTNNYNDQIADYKKKKVVIDGLNSVAANKSMYTTDMQLGEAVLMAKHGDNFDKFKKSMTGTDGDLTRFYTLAKNEGINFNETGVDGTQVKKDFKDKSVIESEYLAEISKIEAETKAALEEAAGDSKTVNAILKLKDRLIGNLKPDSSKVDAIDSVNNTMSTKDGFPKTEKEKLKEVQTNIQTGETTETTETTDTTTEGETGEVKALQSEDVPLFIPGDWKETYNKEYTEAKKLKFSGKEYNKKFSDTVMMLVPDGQTKDYFNIDTKTKEVTSAKIPVINFDDTFQSILKGSINDINEIDTFKITGKDKNKIDFTESTRYDLAVNHMRDYGQWFVDGAVLGKDGSLKNILEKKTVGFIVPANSIINVNNGTLKGYSEAFGTIPKDLRKGVGSTYQKFIENKALERQKVEGGSKQENMNFIQKEIEADNNGNQELTKEARDFIANALLTAKKSNGELYYPEVNKKVSDASEPKSSTMEMKQKEMEDATIGNVRTVKVTINGEEKVVPLTTKNKQILKANNIAIPDVQQEPTAGDGNVMEKVASETVTEKITPQMAGVQSDSNFFTKKADILSILPNDMTGKEIKERYNTDLEFPETFNDFTVYKSTKK